MKDETDKEINALVLPIYEKLKAQAKEKLAAEPDKNVCVVDYVRIDGKKITCIYYIVHWPRGLVEQFEYYDYRYFHAKPL